jgi:hypothetical protein
MIEYRKHKSGRQFARVEGKDVIRVKDMFDRVEVIREESAMMANAVIEDLEMFKPCTEREFKEQFDSAMERINKMTI